MGKPTERVAVNRGRALAMRERGMTFQAIGDALGVTRQRARDYVVGMEVIKRRGYLGKNPLAEKAYEAEKEAMP